MSQIFLSYAAPDRPRIRALVEALTARGWSVWWDRTIPPGKTFDSVIEEALAGAACVVVVWSETSVTSEWVKIEAAEALRRRILVPLRLDDVLPPLEFRRIQAATLIGWDGDGTNEEFSNLVRAVAGTMDTPVPPTPAKTPSRPVVEPPTPRSGVARRQWSRERARIAATVTAMSVVAATAAYLLWPQPPLVIGVMEIEHRGSAPQWMSDMTRESFNTLLFKVKNVKVCVAEKIDLMKRQGYGQIEAAEKLGIGRMISGSITKTDRGMVTLEVDVVDPHSGMLQTRERLQRKEDELIDLENEMAIKVLTALNVPVKPDEVKAIVQARANDDLEYYKRLTESMGVFADEPEPAAPKPPAASPHAWDPGWAADAYAADESQDAVRTLLEQYRTALEKKDVDKLATTYIEMNDKLRDALGRYFQTADELSIRFSDFDILVQGDEAVATFTRIDDFKDRQSGRPVHLEVRVSVVAKQVGTWKIQGLRKPT